MLIVIAIGGNALLKRGETLSADTLRLNCEKAAKSLAPILEKHQVVIVHGNGPQVGLLALQAQAYKEVPPYPFDILDAESQGMIGYALQQALHNACKSKKNIVTLLTQVLVAKDDVAFQEPVKPIGPYYKKNVADKLAAEMNWQFVELDGQFRRVIASPSPLEIIELSSIKQLLDDSNIVIAGGGGGIPCYQDEEENLIGLEAVVDKDMTACRLALDLNADCFVILTDVDGVYDSWGSDDAKLIREFSAIDFSKDDFVAGSMQPKLAAACQFVQAVKRPSFIGQLEKLHDILEGRSGTRVV